ncbi:MAG: MoxR family ATPase [Candidatus Caenarcaniphilales bacterium]|nr:MoxR family ATPase [Candidatus Caenarcaniphilales bacterium]
MKLTVSDKIILANEFEKAAQSYEKLKYEIKKVIVGQDNLIEKIFLAILMGGHCLVEGPPGLAKTLIIKSFSAAIQSHFARIQFTPDLTPSDLTGMQLYNPLNHTFEFKEGPIFTNLLLVDEINRAPAKVQSALLECMQEKQVTIAGQTHRMEELFVVLATQNPQEHEGTYPLPEAQIDRFALKLIVDYPEQHDEESILLRFCSGNLEPEINNVCTVEEILQMRKLIDKVFIEPKIIQKIVKLVQASRKPQSFGLKDLNNIIAHGASPRASIYLAQASKGLALLRGRNYVLSQDLYDVVFDILRHRIQPSHRAQIDGIEAENIIQSLANKFILMES